MSAGTAARRTFLGCDARKLSPVSYRTKTTSGSLDTLLVIPIDVTVDLGDELLHTPNPSAEPVGTSHLQPAEEPLARRVIG